MSEDNFVTLLQLTGLLNSTDHAGVVDRKDGRIFTQAELDSLLDRSDLTWKKKGPLTDQSNKQSTGRKTRKSVGKGTPTAGVAKIKTKLSRSLTLMG